MEAELRDQFAMAALTEAMDMEGSASGRWTEWCANVADMAYDIADAMMKERKRRPPT